MTLLTASTLPLPLLRRGKVREVYQVDADRLLLVASDRVSAFDVVMAEPVPDKGAVLTQLSAFWFRRFRDLVPSHFLTAETAEIIGLVPELASHREQIARRAMLVRRAEPIPFEAVVRGYLSGSAWAEYRDHGTLAGEPMPAGLEESGTLPAPIFSPATKAESGHDENVPFQRVVDALGAEQANRIRQLALLLYQAGRDAAAQVGLIVADTKFEFGVAEDGTLLLIDEILTPDSSRFWPADGYRPGGPQPSFDKQPLRDYLARLRSAGQWDGNAPPPPLPDDVISATTRRYREAYRRLTGQELPA